MSRVARLILLLGIFALSVAGSGCAPFGKIAASFHDITDVPAKSASSLPVIPTSRDAIQLEFVFVERPVGEPLLGEILWNEVDQVGGLDVATRQSLRRNGFRVGHIGSHPPPALEEMLALKSQFATGGSDERSNQLVGRRVVLSSIGETYVPLSRLLPNCSVEIRGHDGVVETKDFRNAQFVFRIKTARDQDGWAKLEFVPEIHYGQNRLRQIATQRGWELRTTQEIHPLFSQRFAITLNVGEMVLITADGQDDRSVGRYFFRGTGKNADVQRLLIVRLSGMTKSDPVYAGTTGQQRRQ